MSLDLLQNAGFAMGTRGADEGGAPAEPPRESVTQLPCGSAGASPSRFCDHFFFSYHNNAPVARRAPRCAPGRTAGLRPAARRAGFTLVELLAALGISVLLIAAVSASLDIYVRVTSSGQAAIECQQVTRALLDQMTRDVASIVFRPAPVVDDTESGEADSSSSASSSESTTTTTTVQDPEAAATSTSVGLVGDSQTLLLHISRPLADLNYAAAQTAVSLTSRTSDLLSVSWFVAQPGADGLSGAVAAQATAASEDQPAVRGSQSPAGLARLEGDRMAMDHADQTQDTAALASAAQVIAPEIGTITFAYFDGQEWVESWDSTAMDRLPQAIEVTFGYRDAAAEAETPTALSSVVPIAQTVRHVIVVPMAEPAAAGSAP